MLEIGQAASQTRQLTQDDFDRFARLSGDDNPIHIDPDFAARSKFGRPVAHGMFLYSLVSGVLGTQLPGPGTVQLEQALMFPSPSYIGDSITIRVEVNGWNPDTGVAQLGTSVRRGSGELGLDGQTQVYPPGDSLPWQAPSPEGIQGAAHDSFLDFKGIRIGQRASLRRTFTHQDLVDYVSLTGDDNPIYTDPDYIHMREIADLMIPGGLLAGLFSNLLGTQLPGSGTNYLKQQLQFHAPAHPNEEILASVEVVRIRPEKQLVNLRTLCTDPAGSLICRGEALVLVSDVMSPY